MAGLLGRANLWHCRQCRPGTSALTIIGPTAFANGVNLELLRVRSNTSFKEETNMSELRYPNESREYRDARDLLLKDEQELIDKVKSVAERRRNLPPGGQLKEDYVFQWANDGKVGKSVKFSELFSDKNTLLLYSFMFGPNWDKPCPSCTSLMDGFDRTWYQVTRHAAFAAIAK